MVEKLEGNWAVGKAFDIHTISSEYLGVDDTGRDRFDNTRSKMGQLVYDLKYGQKPDAVAKIVDLLDTIKGIEGFDALIPIPPTNKERKHQPVQLIAAELGKRREVAVLDDLVANSGDAELKGVTDPVARLDLLRKALSLNEGERVKDKQVLLIDDLYRSGSTLQVATDILLNEAGAARVCVLTMTKTRSNR
ncbi:MAG: phosphoribosyltransferase family protein [Pseudomonadota bacterium]